MNTINALSPVKAVLPATSDGGNGGNTQQFQQQTKPGQTLTATVLEPAGGNRFYLEILGEKILARSDNVSLNPGSKLNLEVLSTKSFLELKIVSKNPDIFFGKTLTLLEKNIDIKELITSLTSPTSPLPSQLSETSQKNLTNFYSLQKDIIGHKDGGSNLKQLFDRLGLSLESSQPGKKSTAVGQTLKSALLEIATIMKDGGEIADTTNRILGTLELYQMAQVRLAPENMLIFPLPLPFLDNGYLIVEKDEAETDTETNSQSRRFSLHLSLEPLGDIEISFLQTEDGLYIKFGCDSKETLEFTSSYQGTLKEILTATDVLGLSFNDSAGSPASNLIKQLLPDGQSMLDTKI